MSTTWQQQMPQIQMPKLFTAILYNKDLLGAGSGGERRPRVDKMGLLIERWRPCWSGRESSSYGVSILARLIVLAEFDFLLWKGRHSAGQQLLKTRISLAVRIMKGLSAHGTFVGAARH